VIDEYLRDLSGAVRAAQCTPYRPDPLRWVIDAFLHAHDAGCKVMLVGNGGSAAIASHIAIDLSKNAGIRATAFNDASALTCLANDYGYEDVFRKQVLYHGVRGDVLVAISSSGKSPNILRAVETAKQTMGVVTFSGFEADNPLRQMGDLNFYVPSNRYGIVETAHLVLLHYVVDNARS
jgi:D-sedoheptulose 7-phosphate isomerase